MQKMKVLYFKFNTHLCLNKLLKLQISLRLFSFCFSSQVVNLLISWNKHNITNREGCVMFKELEIFLCNLLSIRYLLGKLCVMTCFVLSFIYFYLVLILFFLGFISGHRIATKSPPSRHQIATECHEVATKLPPNRHKNATKSPPNQHKKQFALSNQK